MQHKTPRFSTPLAEPSSGQTYRARAEAILWVKSAIARHAITLKQLEEANCFPKVTNHEVVRTVTYRDAAGNAWDGSGAVPEWLQRAVNAGQTMDHFKVS